MKEKGKGKATEGDECEKSGYGYYCYLLFLQRVQLTVYMCIALCFSLSRFGSSLLDW